MFASLILSLSLGHAAFATGESKPLELPNLPLATAGAAGKPAIRVSSSCTTSTGRVLKSGEAGYEGCLSEASSKMNSGARHSKSEMPGSPGAQQTMEVKLGD